MNVQSFGSTKALLDLIGTLVSVVNIFQLFHYVDSSKINSWKTLNAVAFESSSDILEVSFFTILHILHIALPIQLGTHISHIVHKMLEVREKISF